MRYLVAETALADDPIKPLRCCAVVILAAFMSLEPFADVRVATGTAHLTPVLRTDIPRGAADPDTGDPRSCAHLNQHDSGIRSTNNPAQTFGARWRFHLGGDHSVRQHQIFANLCAHRPLPFDAFDAYVPPHPRRPFESILTPARAAVAVV